MSMTYHKQADETAHLAERTRRILVETQAAVDEANQAIKRSHDVVRRARQASQADADLCHKTDVKDPIQP
jgi:methyl-accepting chemotaxis protein